MGIYGMMHTSISGMNAQTNRLSSISDNIANSSTIGYKRSESRFSTMVVSSNAMNYQSGSVLSNVRRNISVEGTHRATGRNEDLSILGNGFFVVSDKKDGSGEKFLTRAGDFQPDKDGFLRNSAGFYLLNELGEVANVGSGSLKPLKEAEATTVVDFKGSLDFDGKVTGDKTENGVTTAIAFDPTKPETYNHKTSVTTYGPKGEKIIVDVYFQKKANDSWNAYALLKDEVYDPGKNNSMNLVFSKDGHLDLDKSTPKGSSLSIKIDDRELSIDFKNLSLGGSSYIVSPKANGNEAGFYESYTMTQAGEILVNLANGEVLSKGFINLGTVPAVDMLSMKSGTVFKTNLESGDIILGRPMSSTFGKIYAGQLEESNADIATELTEMIESQRNFSANSKVFQTGSEIMDVVVNLKR